MDTRRIALTLSAAAGGLAIAALLPLATANADPITYGFSPDMPGSVQDISVGGLAPFDQTLEESGLFDVTQSGSQPFSWTDCSATTSIYSASTTKTF
jgi:hypothetical protein